MVALVLGLPLLATTVYLLGQLGICSAESFRRDLRFTALFAGLPALLTAGGVGRLAARRVIDGGQLMASLRTGAITYATASMGLIVLVAVPIGGLPEEPLRWSWLLVAGATSGALVGAVIGLWAGRGSPSRG